MQLRNLRIPFFAAALVFGQRQAKPTQTPTKPTEPEYIGVFVAVDPSTGALIDLERQTTTQSVRTKGLGYGVREVQLEIPGEKSPVRFKVDAVPLFVLRVASQAIDPQSLIRLGIWKVTEGRRYITVQRTRFGKGATSAAAEGVLPVNIAKYGESSFKISSAQPLTAGEYALGPVDGHECFSFGVDATSP